MDSKDIRDIKDNV